MLPRRRRPIIDTGDETVYSQWQPGLQLEEGNWQEGYNYIRPSPSSLRDEAYREWYETTHPRPHTLDGAIEYWINRCRQLQRCQTNHPLSYEAFLRANQPAEGHPANDTWDYGQLYRLHMIRAQAAQEFESHTITEDDIDNYLIRSALADNQLDNDVASSNSSEQRRVPGSKRTTTKEEDTFFQQSLRTPRPTPGSTSNVNTVRTSTTKLSKFQRNHKNPKHIRNISAIVDTGAQVTTMPESAVSKMPNAHNHRDAPPGTAVKYGSLKPSSA